MKIIAIDSSGLVASVAVVTENQLLAEYTINFKKTHSQTLLPMLDEVVRMLELDLNEIDAIAVAAGPGSFTGLRIGSSTVKGLGLALNKPVIGIPTLEGLAYNLYGTDKLVCPLLDARRSQVYTGLYEFNGEGLSVIEPQKAAAVEEIAEQINGLNRAVVFLGDGVEAYRSLLLDLIKVPMEFAPLHLSKQRAGSVGALAVVYYNRGLLEDADSHEPTYLRVSQAERELAQKRQEEKTQGEGK